MEPRNYLANADTTPPASPSNPSVGYPRPSSADGVEATKPGPHWFYKIGEELRAVIVAAGLAPSDASVEQLLEALGKLYAADDHSHTSADIGAVALTEFDDHSHTPADIGAVALTDFDEHNHTPADIGAVALTEFNDHSHTPADIGAVTQTEFNSHSHTPADIGAVTQTDFNSHSHTPADIGAVTQIEFNDHSHTPADIGAVRQSEFNNHSHTAADVGAVTQSDFNDHSHTPADIGAVTQTEFDGHSHTPTDIGAVTQSDFNSHSHTPADIGAVTQSEFSSHSHTPADIGAVTQSDFNSHSHTPADIGAVTQTQFNSHSHTPADIGAVRQSEFNSHSHTPAEIGAVSQEDFNELLLSSEGSLAAGGSSLSGLGLDFFTEIFQPADYPFADDVADGDLVYLFSDYPGFSPAPLEYRKATEIGNGIIDTKLVRNYFYGIDYGKLTNQVVGFADISGGLIWQAGMPDHVRPAGLAANSEWWLSSTDSGELISTQPFPNRDPLGWTNGNGKYFAYRGALINRMANFSAPPYGIVATEGEDISHRVRLALRRYAAVRVIVPTGVTANITHSRIEVVNRKLSFDIRGRLDCRHRVKFPPHRQFLQGKPYRREIGTIRAAQGVAGGQTITTGDWYLVSSFLLGGNGTLDFSGNGSVHHQVADIGKTDIGPKDSGLVSGLPYQPADTNIPRTLSASGNLKFYLSTSLFNHTGGGSHYAVSLRDLSIYPESTDLNSAPTVVSQGIRTDPSAMGIGYFPSGSLHFSSHVVSLESGTLYGTPNDQTNGWFDYAELTYRSPGIYIPAFYSIF